MFDQTTMNGRHATESPASKVGSNLAGLTHDLMTLAELQCQLVAVDLRDGLSKSLIPVVMIIGAILLALGTMPVILLGIGWSLVTSAGLSIGITFLLVSLAALILAGLVAWWGSTQLIQALSVLKRSQNELRENIRWVKQALVK